MTNIHARRRYGGIARFRLEEAAHILGWRLIWVAPVWTLRPRHVVLVRDLTTPLPDAPCRPDLHWTQLTEADIPRVVALDPRLGPGEIQRRLAEGQACHLCWVGESVAHYRWEASRPAYLPYLGLTVRPLPGDVCGAGVFTDPTFRRAGIHTATTLAALHRLRALGHRRAIAFVAWWNGPSLRVERDRAGRTVVGAVGYWNLGPWRRYVGEGRVRLENPRGFHVAADSEPSRPTTLLIHDRAGS